MKINRFLPHVRPASRNGLSRNQFVTLIHNDTATFIFNDCFICFVAIDRLLGQFDFWTAQFRDARKSNANRTAITSKTQEPKANQSQK
jgi:hypothetical protein